LPSRTNKPDASEKDNPGIAQARGTWFLLLLLLIEPGLAGTP
jgi:hypothetical protein